MASKRSRRIRRTYVGLQRAVSVLFALTSVIPLLVFAYCLYRLGALDQPYYQLSLALALITALAGYVMFRGLMARMSRLLRSIQQVRSAAAPAATPEEAPPHEASREASMVPGLGRVQELDDLVQLLGTIWKPEVLPYLGRRVQVSTRDRPVPLVGTLVDVTDEGLLLEQEGHRLPVGYQRIAAIEAEPAAASTDVEIVESPPPPDAQEGPRPGRYLRED